MGNSKKIKEGNCYKIYCSESDKIFFAREMKFGITSFYYFEDLKENLNLDELIIDAKPIYSNYVQQGVFKELEFLKVIKLSPKEELFAPRFFRQDFTDIEKCSLVIAGQLEAIKCKPEDCIGLERATIHESTSSICEKLFSILTGVKPKLYELYRLRIPGIDKPFDFSKKIL
jgi:hypothetical protein